LADSHVFQQAINRVLLAEHQFPEAFVSLVFAGQQPGLIRFNGNKRCKAKLTLSAAGNGKVNRSAI
jgi:hypothetical protein